MHRTIGIADSDGAGAFALGSDTVNVIFKNAPVVSGNTETDTGALVVYIVLHSVCRLQLESVNVIGGVSGPEYQQREVKPKC